MRHHGALLREALHVVGLLAEVRFGDEEGEVGVLVAGGLKHIIEGALHLLPNGVAMGLYHHAAAHRGVLGEVGFGYHVSVPAGVVLRARCDLFCHDVAFLVCILYFCLYKQVAK